MQADAVPADELLGPSLGVGSRVQLERVLLDAFAAARLEAVCTALTETGPYTSSFSSTFVQHS